MNEDDQSRPVEGRRIGPYRVVREIGRGGMGAVYLAARADEQFEQRVAIKLIKRGMDTDDIIRRFRTERQILANLRHPHIATLLDGGITEEGLPYFAMDYVEGAPIDQYCDQHKLSIRNRLNLFRMICSAVQFAHQNLIVHRDIKPGNIIVTPEGVPVLLDFGIAKLLDAEHSQETMPGQRPMTPECASPEQVRGEPITTASDIYSLGILLYKLLTGHQPYRFASGLPQEIIHVICTQDPEKPSTAISRTVQVPGVSADAPVTLTPEVVSKNRDDEPEKLRRLLSGDLDTIVLKAMQKDPRRRYESVDQFSEDIRRFLEGLPVIAQSDTAAYRAAKFIRRHKVGVTGAALIAVALVGGMVATSWEAHIAERERARAVKRFEQVRQLANSFMFEIHDAIADLPGSTPARNLLVKRAMEYLDSLSREAGEDPALQSELATAYQKMADVQGNPFYANLGDSAGALSSYRKALAIRERLATADPKNAKFHRDLATTYDSVGDMLWATGELAGALDHYRKSLEVRKALLKDSTEAEASHDLALSYERIGDTLAKKGDFNAALESHRDALAIREALSNQDPQNAKARREVSISYGKVGDMLALTGNPTVALDNHRKALALREELAARDPGNSRARRELALGYINVGELLSETGDWNGALENYRKAMKIREDLASADPTNVQASRDLAIIYGTIGEALSATGDKRGAVDHGLKSLEIFKTMSARDPTNRGAREDLAICYGSLAEIMEGISDAEGALRNYRNAVSILEPLVVADPMNAATERRLGIYYSYLGLLDAKQAGAPSIPANKRVELWQQAREWYQKSMNAFRNIQKHGILTGAEPLKADQMAAEVAHCDEALAKLRGTGRTSR